MNRYIVVNTKAKSSTVWETIGDNYTPSKGEVCIIVPPTDKIDTSKEETTSKFGGSSVYTTDDGDANLILHSEATGDNSYLPPISIKIGDGATCFRDLPTLTSGNVQGDWTAVDPTNPSYIRNKPILNDDIFQQGEEQTLLIPTKDIISLFDIKYTTDINYETRFDTYLTIAEKNAIIYVLQQGSYDLKDLTNLNTKVLINNKDKILSKIDKINIHSNITLSDSQLNYLKLLISTGTALIDEGEADLIIDKFNRYVCAEDLQSIVSIKPNQNATIKTFHTNNYVRISSRYFHPNDLLIYNDNNWGYYEIHMFGVDDNNVEINKTPRFWFYKQNVLKTNEKSVISQIIADTIFTNNYRFTKEEREILIAYADWSKPLVDLGLTEEEKIKLIDKIILNPDILNKDYKTFLINCIKKNRDLSDDELLEEGGTDELIKQIQMSQNILGTALGQNEMKELTEEILDQLIKEFHVLDNTIEEKVEKDNIYYELNNEIILDPTDRAIYMNLARLIGYLRQVKNLEIIFHYKERKISSEFFQDTISDWNVNDPESAQFIAHRPIYKTDNGQVTWDDPWFYNWLVALIEGKLIEAYVKIKDLIDRIDALEKEIEAIKKEIENIINENQKYYLQRLKSLIVSQPETPVLTDTFFPKLWICNNDKSGYGVIYWRDGGEDADGNYDETAKLTWLPISTVWTPEPKTITPTEPDNPDTPDTPEKPTKLTYTQLEYIETMPNQYINTGISPALDLSMEYTVKGNNTGAYNEDIYLFGRNYPTTNNSSVNDCRSSIRVIKKNINKFDVYWNKKRMNGIKNGTKYIILDEFSYLDKHTYKMEPSQWSIDGKIYITTININSANKYFDDYPIYLNGLNNGSKGQELGSSFNIYSCKFYKGSTLILDLIPVINNLTNEACMYDLVNKVVYPNANTASGSFKAGPKTETIIDPEGTSSEDKNNNGTDETGGNN